MKVAMELTLHDGYVPCRLMTFVIGAGKALAPGSHRRAPPGAGGVGGRGRGPSTGVGLKIRQRDILRLQRMICSAART